MRRGADGQGLGDLGFQAHGLHIWVVLLSGFNFADLGCVLLFWEVRTSWYFGLR